MLELDTTLRLVVIGQELLLIVTFLSQPGDRQARASAAAMLGCVIAYLCVSNPVLAERLGHAEVVLEMLALLVPHALWLFARAVFEAAWPRRWVLMTFIAITLAVFVLFGLSRSHGDHWDTAGFLLAHFASLVVVLHALYLAHSGRTDDLVEGRRRFRSVFVLLVGLQVTAVLLAELLLGLAAPAWLSLLNVTVIAALTLGLSIPILRLNPEFITPAQRTPRPGAGEPELAPAESVLRDALLAAMQDGRFRQPGLTITALAAALGHPEHQLRRLINGHLGFRNFSAFLNSYRIPAAKARLADPTEVRVPVLTIAMDLGYGSLGPFNRAFKLATGQTPTEYRRTALRPPPPAD